MLHVHWINMGTSYTPPIVWTKIIQFMVFTKHFHEGIAFLLGLNFLFLRVKKGFWFQCKIIVNFLIISSNIHMRKRENVFLIINKRWCKMKEKCHKQKKHGWRVTKMCKNDQVQNNPALKWGTCHNGCLKINWYLKP